MHWAAKRDYTDLIKLLAKRGADVNAADLAGKTPLLLAIRNEHYRTLQTLMELRADPYRKTKSDVCVGDICEGVVSDILGEYIKVFLSARCNSERSYTIDARRCRRKSGGRRSRSSSSCMPDCKIAEVDTQSFCW